MLLISLKSKIVLLLISLILFNCDGDIGENIEKTITMVDGDEIHDELRQIISILNHLAIHTRPDIMFPVTYLATGIKSADKNGTRPMADDPSIWHKLFRDPLSEISKKTGWFSKRTLRCLAIQRISAAHTYSTRRPNY